MMLFLANNDNCRSRLMIAFFKNLINNCTGLINQEFHMQDNENNQAPKQETTDEAKVKKEYYFGGIQEFSLEKIEEAILEDSIYLDVFAGSDALFKENIQPLQNVLSSVTKLSCISYDYKTEEFSQKNFPHSRQVGVIAQEILSAFPELVKHDKDGDLQVNYSQLSTIALQAVKELSSMLEQSNARITKLENEIQSLKN